MNNQFDNNYNYNNNFSEENTFSCDANAKPQKKSRTAAKILAYIMATAIISTGSVSVYRAFEKKDSSTQVVTQYVEKSLAATPTGNSFTDPLGSIERLETSGEVLSTEDIVEKLLPTVVGIESEFTVKTQSNQGMFMFGGSSQPSTQTGTSTGTGVIISYEGYIVTNAHVIYDTEYNAGLSKKISVILSDDTKYDAEVIGYDTDFDIAVLKINADGLTAAEFGNSDDLKQGESVVAIGNPLGFKLKNTVTTGVISGLNRNVTINDKSMTLLQTDAAINSGNSGGPLINKYGQVIGINSSKMSSSYSSASIENIGFAIPSNEVSKIVKDIMDYGYVTGKPQLGISCQDVDEYTAASFRLPVGIYVTSVTEDSAAEKAGLRSGDVITAFDGTEVKTYDELNTEKNKHSAGDTVEITFTRNGEEQTLEVTLDEADNSPSTEDSEAVDN